MFKGRQAKRGGQGGEHYSVPDSQFLLCAKLNDLASKIGAKGMNVAAADISFL